MFNTLFSESCDTPNTCLSTQYRGKDCKCYCKNDLVNGGVVPAIVCDGSKNIDKQAL